MNEERTDKRELQPGHGNRPKRDRSIFSARHHEGSNRDTSDRIKRAHRGRFKNGGALRRLISGIIKRPGAKTDEDLYLDDHWRKVYDEWFTRLENG
jgi:hypothetical protein